MTEVLLSEDSGQVDQDGRSILEALYEQYAASDQHGQTVAPGDQAPDDELEPLEDEEGLLEDEEERPEDEEEPREDEDEAPADEEEQLRGSRTGGKEEVTLPEELFPTRPRHSQLAVISGDTSV